MHVWVAVGGVNIRELGTYAQNYPDCSFSSPCPCENIPSKWPQYCTQDGNLNHVDGVTSATVAPGSITNLTWDLKDRSGTLLPNGAGPYTIQCEVSGYWYGTPGEATVSVNYTGCGGSAPGSLSGTQITSMTASW
jgi:hypothetical protein